MAYTPAVLVPLDGDLVPSVAAVDRLRAEVVPMLEPLAAKHAEVEVEVTDHPHFVFLGPSDPPSCPNCLAGHETEWLVDRLSESYDRSRFRDRRVVMPCCEVEIRLEQAMMVPPLHLVHVEVRVTDVYGAADDEGDAAVAAALERARALTAEILDVDVALERWRF